MEYRDASGLSTRSETAGTASITGTNAYNTEELDGLGNNVGRLGDLSRPPHEGGPTRSPADSPTIDDMTMGDCTLDGIPVPCSMAFRSLRSGSALPAHLAKQYQHSPAFAFTPTGSGAFTVTLPKQVGWHVNPDGSIDRIYSQYSGTSHIFSYFSFTTRRVTDEEARILKESVTTAADKTELCRKYIKDLIEKVAENAGLGVDDIVSTNVEELFDIVLASRGGDKPEYGGIFLRASDSTHTAKNYWKWVGAPGFAEVHLSYGTGHTGSIQDRLAMDKAGITAIHELLHVAVRSRSRQTDDLAYARAAADLAGESLPDWKYDKSREITAENRPINYQASEYWGERLNQACGFPSQITNKMTDHILYR